MIKKNKYCHGFTLIEIIIALALVGIILTVLSSQFSFSLFTFSKGEAQSQIQFETRMAASDISSKVRNSIEIALLDGYSQPTFNGDYEYFIIDGNELKHVYFDNSVKEQTLSDKIDQANSSFNITFHKNRYFLHFTLTTLENHMRGTQKYDISTSVLLNNITSPPIGTETPGKLIIQFKKP